MSRTVLGCSFFPISNIYISRSTLTYISSTLPKDNRKTVFLYVYVYVYVYEDKGSRIFQRVAMFLSETVAYSSI